MSGLVTFRLGEREYAASLDDVREVVRLQGLADLPGAEPPLAGVVELRGTALPVLDLRSPGGATRGPAGGRDASGGRGRGDVLVLERPDGPVGVAVDQVRAVLPPDGLPVSAERTSALPAYVLAVLRGSTGPVFLVALEAMVAAVGGRAAPAPAVPAPALEPVPEPAAPVEATAERRGTVVQVPDQPWVWATGPAQAQPPGPGRSGVTGQA